MSDDTIRVAEEGDIDLNVIVNEEAEQYGKAARVQGVIDNTNESNSGLVKGHDEETGEENEKEDSGNIVYRRKDLITASYVFEGENSYGKE